MSVWVPSVSFLGHRIDADGVHPLPDKVDAIKNAPTPQNVRQLKSYLGLLSYYSKYLPNLSSVLAPLYHFYVRTLSGDGQRLSLKHLSIQRSC